MTHHIGLIGGRQYHGDSARAARAIPGSRNFRHPRDQRRENHPSLRQHGGDSPIKTSHALSRSSHPWISSSSAAPPASTPRKGVAAARHGLQVPNEKPIEIKQPRAPTILH